MPPVLRIAWQKLVTDGSHPGRQLFVSLFFSLPFRLPLFFFSFLILFVASENTLFVYFLESQRFQRQVIPIPAMIFQQRTLDAKNDRVATKVVLDGRRKSSVKLNERLF
jgi:hypothetical protein